MTTEEINDLLSCVCNYFENPQYVCDISRVRNQRTYSFKCSIIKYDIEKYIEDLNKEFQNNDDLKQGLITSEEVQHALKIKHSVFAESVEWSGFGKVKETDIINQLFKIFIRKIGHLATEKALQIKNTQP